MSVQTGAPATVAVVTGAARGLGEHVARRLVARGWAVALVGHEPERLAEVAAELGPNAAWWQVDVTDEDALRAAADQIVERFGGVDVVVANAGVALGATLMLSDPRAWDRVIEVNLLGSVRTARAFLPHLLARRGYLLQIASLIAVVPIPMLSAYAASKAGVEAYARAVEGELRHRGVRVGIAYPTWVDTDMVRGADAVRAFAANRAALPWPFNRTITVDRAADLLVAGVLKRRRRVFVPGWVRLAAMIRPMMHLTVAVIGPRRAAEAERGLQAELGDQVSTFTGAGGSADAARR